MSIFVNGAYYLTRARLFENSKLLSLSIRHGVAEVVLRLNTIGKVAVNDKGRQGVVMSETLSIHHDQAGHQFETNVDGHRAYLTYMDLGKQTLDIYRTFVPNALRGRGIAAALTEHALAFAHQEGYTVIPSCSYVERYMERHQKDVAKI